MVLLMLLCLEFLGIHVGACQGMQPYFITWGDLFVENYTDVSLSEKGKSDRGVIFVSKDGRGDSRTVQGAVDMVPGGNTERVKIFIFPGVYREKVIVPSTKPYVSFIGNGSGETIISWHAKASDRLSDGQTMGTLGSASVAVESDYFCANGITFENTAPSAPPGAVGKQAVALRVSGDKAVLYKCKILGSQDTLYDHQGRHFFYKCYIEGSIDFIFGDARSLYQACTLHAIAESYGAIAASQRSSPTENSGFSFTECKIDGSGLLYLGRAWGKYARVIYSFCQMEGIIMPQGWNDWGDSSRRKTVWFGEFGCGGRGANLSQRVPWARSLNYEEAKPFLDHRYIDGERWLRL